MGGRWKASFWRRGSNLVTRQRGPDTQEWVQRSSCQTPKADLHIPPACEGLDLSRILLFPLPVPALYPTQSPQRRVQELRFGSATPAFSASVPWNTLTEVHLSPWWDSSFLGGYPVNFSCYILRRQKNSDTWSDKPDSALVQNGLSDSVTESSEPLLLIGDNSGFRASADSSKWRIYPRNNL